MSYVIESAESLSAVDLNQEIAELQAAGTAYEIARVTVDDKAEKAQVLWIPSLGRGGVAWGADADWSDASDIHDLVERYLGIDDKEMS